MSELENYTKLLQGLLLQITGIKGGRLDLSSSTCQTKDLNLTALHPYPESILVWKCKCSLIPNLITYHYEMASIPLGEVNRERCSVST